jgi:hypothetical protein
MRETTAAPAADLHARYLAVLDEFELWLEERGDERIGPDTRRELKTFQDAEDWYLERAGRTETLRDRELAEEFLANLEAQLGVVQAAYARETGQPLENREDVLDALRRAGARHDRYCRRWRARGPLVIASRAPRRTATSSGRPRAQATRSSAASGDSPDEPGESDPPPQAALYAFACISWELRS